jgi:predicted nucleic acid-binding protein
MYSVNSPRDGLLDTNVFLHAVTTDRHAEECSAFLTALQRGMRQAWLDPLVLHELSYSIRHYRKQMTRDEVAEYLLGILDWPGIQGDKDIMVEVVQRWQRAEQVGFVDAYLATLATRGDLPVFTKNVRDLAGEGARVPDPLPS